MLELPVMVRRNVKRKRAARAASSTLLLAACSVFPDHAILPDAGGSSGGSGAAAGTVAVTWPDAGAGRTGSESGTGGSGAPSESASGRPGVSGVAGASGAANGGGAAAGSSGTSGTSAGGAGTSGDVGAAGCASPVRQAILASADAWIDSGTPGSNYGSDTQLHLSAGASERRTLIAFAWQAPAFSPSMRRAALVLTLASDQDVTGAARKLKIGALTQGFTESKVTWTNYGPGAAHRWGIPGGDLGPATASTNLPRNVATGTHRIDVSSLVSATSTSVQLILLESSLPPSAPADLLWQSREASAGAPKLVLDDCP